MKHIFQNSPIRFAAFLIVVLIATSCDSCKTPVPGENTTSFDRKAMLDNYANAIIEPSFVDFGARVTNMQTSLQAFCETPSATTLEQARSDWRSALLSWQTVMPFNFGPAEDHYLHTNANVFPVDANQIETNISSGNYNFDAANQLDTQGLQGIEYLLFNASDAAILEQFTSADHSSARKAYLAAVGESLLEKANATKNDWATYKSDFIANDGLGPESSIGLMLNALIKSLEKDTRTLKLGLPAGAMSFSMEPVPELVEAYFENDNSTAYMQASVDALRNIYLGSEGKGLDDYLIARDARYNDITLHQAIVDQLADMDAGLEPLQNPLSEFVVSNQATALEAYSDMQGLIVLWKVDLMSSLGVLITYQDNDGD